MNRRVTKADRKPFSITNVQIKSNGRPVDGRVPEKLWRNFAGDPTAYKNGERYFNIEVSEQLGKKLADDGFNVKFPDEEGLERGYKPRLQIKVGTMYVPEVNTINGQPQYREATTDREKDYPVLMNGTRLDLDQFWTLDDLIITSANVWFSGNEYAPGKRSAWLRRIDISVYDRKAVTRYSNE